MISVFPMHCVWMVLLKTMIDKKNIYVFQAGYIIGSANNVSSMQSKTTIQPTFLLSREQISFDLLLKT